MSDEEFLANLGNIDNEKLIQSLQSCGHDGYYNDLYYPIIEEIKRRLSLYPSAEPKRIIKIGQRSGKTLESAIDYLRSVGWLQEHDRILTESAEPERTAKVVRHETKKGVYFCCDNCWNPVHSEGKYCHHCGAKLDWSDDE